ncbi:MAG: PmoA family protein [Ignavibacteriae bacterium]|nr:PmoA family protein [Ignavibacteriota bacterium]
MKNKISFAILFLVLIFISCSDKKEDDLSNQISIVKNDAEKKVDILIDGKLFTSYIYDQNISVLKKTVLYPLVSSNGVAITRGFPLDPRPNERVDHPHHIGAWLNYGDVNGLDYWNNSDAISEERKNEMGTIRGDEILEIKEGNGEAELLVTENWLKPNGDVLLKEKTKFIFTSNGNERIIDRITTLTSQNEDVSFKDNKEGMVAIRVARQLEHPSEKPVTLSDAHGKKTDVPVLDNSGVTGHYLSSEGIEGEDVWGKRARWVSLDGTIDGKDVTVAIFDNPQNVGFPTYWHARGYGLFAANPLGQEVFSDGKEVLNFMLKTGESVTFKYRILIKDGKVNKEMLENCYKDFTGNN